MERLVVVVDLALLRCPLAHRRWHPYLRRHHVAATGPVLAAHLVGIEHREESMMAGLTDLACDERAARMLLSLLVNPNDPVTGHLLAQFGAVETLWFVEHDCAVVGLSSVDAQVWWGYFDAPAVKGIASRLDQVQRSGVRELIPGDADWLVALDDLGEGAPDVLWARGASSLLARPVQDFIMITGHALPLPTATILPANLPFRWLRTNG